MDKKTSKLLLNAFEQLKADTKQRKIKSEQQLWTKMARTSKLHEMLRFLNKHELDTIRKNLNVKGVSALKKDELARILDKSIKERCKSILYTLDEERYGLMQKIIANSGAVTVSNEFPTSKVTSLMGYGIIFPIVENNEKLLTMPLELVELFANLAGHELKNTVHRNTEWIHLTHGLLYYYGVMDTSLVLDRIKILTQQEIDIKEYFDVFSSASDYYGQVRFSSYGVGLEDSRVFEGKACDG
jgi:hypothetical protein